MKRLLPILLIILCIVPVGATFSWTASLEPGTKFYINNLTAIVDFDPRQGKSMLIVNGTHILEGEERTLGDMTFKIMTFNNKTYVSITSSKPFEIRFSKPTTSRNTSEDEQLKKRISELESKVKSLQDENARLKRRLSELEKQKQTADVSKLKRQIANLTKENRALREQIANLTERINALLGENEFLKQQNSEYKKLISSLLKEQAQRSEQDYLEKAKREKLIGSILLKSLAFSSMIVITVGYLLYRAKRSYEYGGL